MKIFKEILIKFRAWNNLRRSFISLRWISSMPRFVVHEKYEKSIKWILRVLAFIGIASSIFVFPTWWISLIFAIGFFGLEQIFEKTIFQYTSIFIQPLPSFEYKPKEWSDMGFMIPVGSDKEKLLNVVGCIFASENYAKKFFSLLRAWNYMNKIDYEKNICLSFIIENDREYSTYLYPNLEREIIKQYFREVEEDTKIEKYGKRHQKLVVQMIFCKLFSYGSEFGLKKFIENQSKDKPFWLEPFIKDRDGNIQRIETSKPILVFHFKVKERQELTEKDLEYQHGKSVMGKW